MWKNGMLLFCNQRPRLRLNDSFLVWGVGGLVLLTLGHLIEGDQVPAGLCSLPIWLLRLQVSGKTL